VPETGSANAIHRPTGAPVPNVGRLTCVTSPGSNVTGVLLELQVFGNLLRKTRGTLRSRQMAAFSMPKPSPRRCCSKSAAEIFLAFDLGPNVHSGYFSVLLPLSAGSWIGFRI